MNENVKKMFKELSTEYMRITSKMHPSNYLSSEELRFLRNYALKMNALMVLNDCTEHPNR